uniref:Uncharacterized protein n=1 Tax=Arundo donax TaxID=35708 RepID=A0A0A9BHG7_ARUDO
MLLGGGQAWVDVRCCSAAGSEAEGG